MTIGPTRYREHEVKVVAGRSYTFVAYGDYDGTLNLMLLRDGKGVAAAYGSSWFARMTYKAERDETLTLRVLGQTKHQVDYDLFTLTGAKISGGGRRRQRARRLAGAVGGFVERAGDLAEIDGAPRRIVVGHARDHLRKSALALGRAAAEADARLQPSRPAVVGWRRAAELGDDAAKRIDVLAAEDLRRGAGLPLLGRRVAGRAHAGEDVGGAHQRRQPEVDEHRVAAVAQDDVLRLEVAMGDLVLMQRGDAAGELGGDGETAGEIGGAVAEDLAQRRAVDEILHQNQFAGFGDVEIAGAGGEARRHLARRLDLAAHGRVDQLAGGAAALAIGAQALDGDLLAGRHVDGALDRAEAAAAERGEHKEAHGLAARADGVVAGEVGDLVGRPEAVGGGAHPVGQRRQAAGAAERLDDGGLRLRHVAVPGEDPGEVDGSLDLVARQVVVGEAQTRLAQGGDRRLGVVARLR